MFMPRLPTVLVALSALSLSACVVAPYPRHAVYGQAPVYNAPVDDGYMATVEVAPPAPIVEVIPAIPFPEAIWIGGYWGWVGGRHTWVGGHWDHRRAGYQWRPHAWVHLGGHWHLRGGGWARH